MTVSKVVKGAEKVRDPGPLSLRERARVGPSPPAHLPKGEGRVRDLVIVVNPGSTSTKLAVYRGLKCVAEQAINHPKDELAKFERVTDQYEFRLEAVMAFLAISGIELDRCLAVAGRGGLTKPLLGGVYRRQRSHDPRPAERQVGRAPVEPGRPRWRRRSAGRPVPRRSSSTRWWWTSSGRWRVIRVTRPSPGRAASTPFRSGRPRGARPANWTSPTRRPISSWFTWAAASPSAPTARAAWWTSTTPWTATALSPRSGAARCRPARLVAACFAGEKTQDEVWKMLVGRGGIYAHLGTNDCREVEARIGRGDAKAGEVYEAMAYQIAKWVGATAAVLSGKVQAVVVCRRHGAVENADPADSQVLRLHSALSGLSGNGRDGRPG